MLHGGGLEKASPARTIETHSPPGIEKTLNNMLREKENGVQNRKKNRGQNLKKNQGKKEIWGPWGSVWAPTWGPTAPVFFFCSWQKKILKAFFHGCPRHT